jgi:hypothetical protein
LAFAKQLNRTLVLTGIKKHYTDRGLGFERNGYTPLRAPSANSSSESEKVMQSCFKERTPHFIEFEEVLDRWGQMQCLMVVKQALPSDEDSNPPWSQCTWWIVQPGWLTPPVNPTGGALYR